MRGPSQGSCFNPTLVRLRPHPLAAAGLAAPGFQSHAGSIEAGGTPHCRHRLLAFQSHAGSIEALGDPLRPGRAFQRFNPTLVRLRRDTIGTCKHIEMVVSIPRWFD